MFKASPNNKEDTQLNLMVGCAATIKNTIKDDTDLNLRVDGTLNLNC